MPRALNLVPALREESLEIIVREDDKFDGVRFSGAEDAGIVRVLTKPRMTEVSIREQSRASLS